MRIDAIIHRDRETLGYWAETPQLPGCFAAGGTRDELEESFREAVMLYCEGEDPTDLLTSDHVEGIERYRFSQDEGLVRA
jgi:predicted RNase H-like HicB family nuclease